MKVFSIIVPVYQNEENLPETVPSLLALKSQLVGLQMELVLVDDGSRDGSRKLIEEFVRQHPEEIRGVFLTRNFGQTAAIQAGLRYAIGDCIGIISCDLQEPHELFIEMVEAWRSGAKFVLGERLARAEDGPHQLVSSIYWRLVRRFAFPDFPEMGYDFCLLDRQIADDINRIEEKNSSIFVLIFWLGYRPHRISIRRELRQKGHSQWRFWKKISFTTDTLIGFTYLPARVITFSGLASAILCLLYMLKVVAVWFLLRAAPPGWVTVVGLLLLLGALILFSLGIVSEYLLRILDEARRRPPFVVDCFLRSGKPSQPLAIPPLTKDGND
jgi:polyisoprenyl-phosphate glycosyltransferase